MLGETIPSFSNSLLHSHIQYGFERFSGSVLSSANELRLAFVLYKSHRNQSRGHPLRLIAFGIREVVDVDDLLCLYNFLVDRFAPRFVAVKILLVLIDALHAVMPDAARTKIDVANRKRPAARP